MKTIDSEALALLSRTLGLAGSGSQHTELEDGLVSQVLDIVPVIRRGLAPVGTGGIFHAMYQFTHGAGATGESQTTDPYNIPAALSPNQWPTPVPEGMDVWLLGVSGIIFAATAGNFDTAVLDILGDDPEIAWWVDEAGSPLSSGGTGIACRFPLVTWDQQASYDGAVSVMENSLTQQSYFPLNRRLRRGERIKLTSRASNAVGVQFNVLFGLFPIGMGQDIAP